MESTTTKDRLRKKLNNKKNKRTGKESTPEKVDEESLFTMLNQVNQMLKTNPNMIKKVSKCVNSIFENKDLMSSLVSEIENNVKLDQEDFDSTNQEELDSTNQVSQTLDNNSDVVKPDAELK